MFRSLPWQLLLLKLAALFSFCGGPLVVADSLKTQMDKDAAFAIAFVPIVGLIFGAYSLWESLPDRLDNAMVILGALSALALLGMNMFAVLDLIDDPDRRSQLKRRVEKALKTDASDADYPKLAGMTGGQIHIRDMPPLIFHPAEARVDDYHDVLDRVFATYRETLADDRRALFDRYHLVDAALKVVGVGSVIA